MDHLKKMWNSVGSSGKTWLMTVRENKTLRFQLNIKTDAIIQIVQTELKKCFVWVYRKEDWSNIHFIVTLLTKRTEEKKVFCPLKSSHWSCSKMLLDFMLLCITQLSFTNLNPNILVGTLDVYGDGWGEYPKFDWFWLFWLVINHSCEFLGKYGNLFPVFMILVMIVAQWCGGFLWVSDRLYHSVPNLKMKQ